jgi:hypothetical protein
LQHGLRPGGVGEGAKRRRSSARGRPRRSVVPPQIWRQLLPHAELWEAEYDAACVAKARAKGQLEGIKTVTGDQGDFAVLRRWAEEIGGELDVIIDDGGHRCGNQSFISSRSTR